MTKDWRDYAEHILASIDRVRDYRERARLREAPSDMAYDAIVRVLETVSDAAAYKLPEAVKERHPEIDWQAIRGMRNRLTHDYLEIDPAVIESTIAHDLDSLYEAMKQEVPDWDVRRDRNR